MFWLGVGPNLVLDKIEPSLDRVLAPVTALQPPAAGHEAHAVLESGTGPGTAAVAEEVAR
jgi:hypothetical protein